MSAQRKNPERANRAKRYLRSSHMWLHLIEDRIDDRDYLDALGNLLGLRDRLDAAEREVRAIVDERGKS